MEQTLAGLGNRVFLLHNVHDDHDVVFLTRWALCYLTGPLTRNQIKKLMDPVRDNFKLIETAEKPTIDAGDETHADSRSVLPPEVAQFFVPVRGSQPAGAKLVYKPQLMGCGQIYYSDKKADIDMNQDYSYLAEITDDAVAVDWSKADLVELADSDLEKEPTSESALFASLPREAAKPKSYDNWKKGFADFLFRNQKISVFQSAALEAVSKPNESERDFRVRLQQKAREERDQKAEQLRQAMTPKLAALDEKIRKAMQAVEAKGHGSKIAKLMAIVSFGATILGAFLSRKMLSTTNINKAATAVRGAARTTKASQEAAAATENVEALKKQKEELETEFKTELDALATTIDPLKEPLEEVQIRPKKTNITVRVLALAWVPWWKSADGKMVQGWE
jgi:hypothetical protein